MTLLIGPVEKPVIFKPELVKAIMDGKKRMTRRIVPDWQLPKFVEEVGEYVALAQQDLQFGGRYGISVNGKTEHDCMMQLGRGSYCPYGNFGEVLWVREKWGVVNQAISATGKQVPWVPNRPALKIKKMPFGKQRKLYSGHVIYRADGEHMWNSECDDGSAWHPSIHLPRVAARLFLDVCQTRVECLHSITDEDAIAEGTSGAAAFHELWRELYGVEEWEKNPWVWVISFRQASHRPEHYTD